MTIKCIPAQLLILIVISTVTSCEQESSTTEATTYAYSPPDFLNDGWLTGTLEEARIEVEPIEELTQSILDDQFSGIHSMLIVRDGKLVYENYFNEWTADQLHPMFSVTKSFSSTLIGTAIQRDLIENDGLPLTHFFPDIQVDQEVKSTIQLRHILTMTAGLKWDEWSLSYVTPGNSHWEMMASPSQIDYVINLPVVANPGDQFAYSTGLSNLFAPILESSSQTPLIEYAEEALFDPLQITYYEWPAYIDSYPSTGGSDGALKLRPRDMAKLGQLYLNEGIWNEQRLLSENWVETSIASHVSVSTSIDYGYQWWSRSYFHLNGEPLTEFDAVGDGGQFIFVFAELNLVIAFTGGNNTWLVESDRMFQPITIVRDYILPAVER